MKIDLEKFICFMRNTFAETEVRMAIDDFLKQQGLEYKDGAIVGRIEQKFKVGDVLAASDGSIFLFAGVVDCACKYYVALKTDNVIIFDERLEHYWETSRAVHLASKEQRDLLFQKMKEAGYKWNAEELKLEKIEELSEFEKAVHDRIKDYDIEVCSDEEILEYSKVVAHELLELARKELEKQK